MEPGIERTQDWEYCTNCNKKLGYRYVHPVVKIYKHCDQCKAEWKRKIKKMLSKIFVSK